VALPTTLRALKHRNFRLFVSGQVISLIGSWIQTVAQAWLVYRLTGSSLLLGTVAFTGQIPVFLLAPIGGIVADRGDRRRIVVATQIASMALAGVLAVLTLTDSVRVWHVMVLSALLGVVNAFDIPARQSFLVDMVGKDDLMNAIALNSSIFNGARVLGPGIAGLMVAALGEGWCFLLNTLSYLAVIAGLLMMKVSRHRLRHEEGSPLDQIVQGFRFAWRTMPVRDILLLVGLISAVGMPYTVLMPIFADQILGGGARGLGILMSATGLGALGGALFLASRSTVRGLGRFVTIAAGGFALSMALFAYSPYFWLSAAALVPTGGFMMLQMASSNTLLQAMVPDHLRGRVMALYTMMFMGMAPLGALFAGAAAHSLGAPMTVGVGAVACLIGTAVFAARLPALRTEARALIIAQGLSGGEPPQEMVGGGVALPKPPAKGIMSAREFHGGSE
jgi:MFS family permease